MIAEPIDKAKSRHWLSTSTDRTGAGLELWANPLAVLLERPL
jgi:hypothetical protein